MLSPHTSYRWRGERVIETIKCMRSPHTRYRWRGERVIETIQVYALTTHQLQVERRESHRDNQVYALTTHQHRCERRESHRDNQVYALHHPPPPHTTPAYRWRGGERVIERQSSVCVTHTPAIRLERRGTRVIDSNQVYASQPPHQLQVERRESA